MMIKIVIIQSWFLSFIIFWELKHESKRGGASSQIKMENMEWAEIEIANKEET